jgi:hypothetical protein
MLLGSGFVNGDDRKFCNINCENMYEGNKVRQRRKSKTKSSQSKETENISSDPEENLNAYVIQYPLTARTTLR